MLDTVLNTSPALFHLIFKSNHMKQVLLLLLFYELRIGGMLEITVNGK